MANKRGNPQNLIPLNKRSKEEREAIQEKGRQAFKRKSAENMRMKKAARTILNMTIRKGDAADIEKIRSIQSIKGKNLTVGEKAILEQVLKAYNGDLNALRWLAELTGEMEETAEDRKEDDGGFIEALNSRAADDWSSNEE